MTKYLSKIVVLFILPAALFIGVTSADPSAPYAPTVPDATVTDNGGMELSPDTMSESGVEITPMKLMREEFALYDVSPLAETASVLTATISPQSTDDKRVDWIIEWANPQSEWAKDKNVTEHIKLTPASDGALTATIACLKEFGEPAVVKVVPRANTNLSATCTVDYRQKLLGVGTQLSSSLGSEYNYNTDPTGGAKTFEMLPLESQGEFTKMGYVIYTSEAYTIPIYSISMQYLMMLSQSFNDALLAQGLTAEVMDGRGQYVDSGTLPAGPYANGQFADMNTSYANAYRKSAAYIGKLCLNLAYGDGSLNADKFYKFITAAKATEGYHFKIELRVDVNYGSETGDAYNHLDIETEVTFSSKSLIIYPDDVGVSDGSIVF